MKKKQNIFLTFLVLLLILPGLAEAKKKKPSKRRCKKNYSKCVSVNPFPPMEKQFEIPNGTPLPNGGILQTQVAFIEGRDTRVDPKLKYILEGVSKKIKPRNITITSAYRDCAYNKSVCGAVKSQHLGGQAIDYAIPGYTSGQLQAISQSLDPKYGVGGAGKYCEAYSHVDTGERRDWDWCSGKSSGNKYKRKKKRN